MRLKEFKRRLATVSVDSWRYKLVNQFWKSYRIQNHKACYFYWVMLPTSAVGGVAFAIAIAVIGPALLLFMLLTASLAWFLGFTIAIFDDRGHNYHREGFYPYRYSPFKGEYKRWAPWQIALPVLGVAGLLALVITLVASSGFSWVPDATSSTGDWFAGEWRVIGIIALILAQLYLIGNAIRSKAFQAAWGKACPNLELVSKTN